MGPSQVRGHWMRRARPRARGCDERRHCTPLPAALKAAAGRRAAAEAGVSGQRSGSRGSGSSGPADERPLGDPQGLALVPQEAGHLLLRQHGHAADQAGRADGEQEPVRIGPLGAARAGDAVGADDHRAVAQLPRADERRRRRVRHDAVPQGVLDEHAGGLEPGKRRPPEVARVGHGVGAAAEPLDPREVLLDREGAGRGRHDRPVAAKREILPEVAGQVQERRLRRPSASLTRGRKTGESRATSGTGPPGTTSAPTRTRGSTARNSVP